jgi:distribution and morphology protein 34
MTLVFRNDPVESMRVQSTFDSVPFIKDYLQQEIERQVRELFQEELPLSVYRLSLRLLDPENRDPPGDLLTPESLTPGEDNIDDDSFIDPIYNSSDNADIPPRFSEHSMLRLHALVNSQKTLSPITPAISGAISRATPPCVIQADSNSDRISHLDSSDTLSAIGLVTHSDHAGPRPCLHSSTSSAYSVGSNGCQQPIARRKKKHRVVNLRRGRNISSLSSETSSSCDDSTTKITSTASEPESGSASACQSSSLDAIRPKEFPLVDTNPILSIPTPIRLYSETPPNPLRLGQPHRPPLPIHRDRRPPHLMPSSGINLGSTNTINLQEHGLQEPNGIRPRGIVEKAFMMKFMAEIQKQAEEQRDRLI